MKFRDGMWMVAEGMRVEYAEEVHEITETKRGVSLLCPTRKILTRGDTLNRSTVTLVSYSLPAAIHGYGSDNDSRTSRQRSMESSQWKQHTGPVLGG
jgi:hypothetical protein